MRRREAHPLHQLDVLTIISRFTSVKLLSPRVSVLCARTRYNITTYEIVTMLDGVSIGVALLSSSFLPHTPTTTRDIQNPFIFGLTVSLQMRTFGYVLH